ncbi:MAG: hypothetical protein MUE40_03150 [Anaerolineae bacterium]|jgi:hypothetical protein|nr:hypothetical protein [Anaerolineae bacterium]
MAISVGWYDGAQTILIWRFGESWTWDEYYAALEQTNQVLRRCSQPVALIVDTREARSFPRGLLTHAANGIETRQEGIWLAVVVIGHPVLRAIYDHFLPIAERLLPRQGLKMTHADDVESALRLIETRLACEV